MKVEWDESKRQATLDERDLDFADFCLVFENPVYQFSDNRKDYGEDRIICYGSIKECLVCIIYTMRNEIFRVISMRKAHEKEARKYITL